MIHARIVALIVVLAIKAGTCCAQDKSFPKELFYEFSAFAGGGIADSQTNRRKSFHFGVDMRANIPATYSGFLLELGYASPPPSRDPGIIFSGNYLAPFTLGKSSPLLLFGTAGYTRHFGIGNAFNYGIGIDYRISETTILRFEARDYVSSTDPVNHNAAFRIGIGRYGSD